MKNEERNDIEVQGTKQVTETKKQGVTQKTLKAWVEQSKKIIEEELLEEKEKKELINIMGKVRANWIIKNLG